MAVKGPQTVRVNGAAQVGTDLDGAIHAYVRTYATWHGRPKAAEALGVSRHTLWRFLNRGHSGRAIPRTVLKRVGHTVRDIEAAREGLIAEARLWEATQRRLKEGGRATSSTAGSKRLSEALEDALRLLCATPLATVDELSLFGRIPASTVRERLGKLATRGLVDSVLHQLSVLGSRPQLRYFPTKQGIVAGGRIEHGMDYFLSEYPVSKQWFRLLSERMDAVAVLHRVAAMLANADSHEDTVRVDHYRNGPYDMLVTLSGGRSIGIVRQGQTLPTSNLRYRLRSVERMRSRERPFVTLVLTHADQATRRAIRSLGDPSEHRRTFVATEGELLAGDHTGAVWQQCGDGRDNDLPVRIDPGASLRSILAWMDRLLDSSHSFFPRQPEARPRRPLPFPFEGRHAGACPATHVLPCGTADPRREGSPRPAVCMAPVHP